MAENPYESPNAPEGVSMPASVTRRWLVLLLGGVAVFGLIFALIISAPRSAREAARRNACRNNLKQIALALLNYERHNGTLPPAYTVDAEGNRLHSWRTLLLPHLDQQELFDSIDLTKPWDDPANAAARETVVDVLVCPSYPGELVHSTYQLITGPGSAYEGPMAPRLEDITDNYAETILVIEVATDDAEEWMSPTDITIESITGREDLSTLSRHPGGFHAAYADGHVVFHDVEINRDALRALLTTAGGDEVGDW